MAAIGFRILPHAPQPDPVLLDRFIPVITAHLSDNMARLSGTVGLQRYSRRGKMVGAALTVRTRPGDNLMVHKALDMLRPRDVLVVDGAGQTENALVGELMASYAQSQDCAGFVIDGAICDVAWFDDFPCYARGNTHRGPYKDGPGEINVPVSVGGMLVYPGDILVGDEDGVVAVRPSEAEILLALAAKKAAEEEQIKRDIARGTHDQSWVDNILAAKGVPLTP